MDDILYHIAYSLAFAFLRIPQPHKLIVHGLRSWEFDSMDGLSKKVKVTVEVVDENALAKELFKKVPNVVVDAGVSQN